MATIQSLLNKIADFTSRIGLGSIGKSEFFQLLVDMTNKIGEVSDNVNSVAKSLIWQNPVNTFANLATTYPTPVLGWAALVKAPAADGNVYVYSWNGTAWKSTGLKNDAVAEIAINNANAAASNANTAASTVNVAVLSAGFIGGIFYNAAAPTPARSGYYEFLSAGNCTLITAGSVSVNIGDRLIVEYTAPSSYVYKYMANPNYKQIPGTSTNFGISQKALADFYSRLYVVSNYFDPSAPDHLIGKFMSSNGSISGGTNSDYNTTGFILIDKVAATAYAGNNGSTSSFKICGFFDANFALIGTTTSTVPSVSIPNGAVYFRATYYSTDLFFQIEFGTAFSYIYSAFRKAIQDTTVPDTILRVSNAVDNYESRYDASYEYANKIIGKNIFNSGDFVGAAIVSNKIFQNNYEKVTASTQYKSNDNICIKYYDKYFVQIGSIVSISSSTFITPSTAKYAKFGYPTNAGINAATIQIELGSSSTTYESYGFKIAENLIPSTIAKLNDIPDVNYLDRNILYKGNVVVARVNGNDHPTVIAYKFVNGKQYRVKIISNNNYYGCDLCKSYTIYENGSLVITSIQSIIGNGSYVHVDSDVTFTANNNYNYIAISSAYDRTYQVTIYTIDETANDFYQNSKFELFKNYDKSFKLAVLSDSIFSNQVTNCGGAVKDILGWSFLQAAVGDESTTGVGNITTEFGNLGVGGARICDSFSGDTNLTSIYLPKRPNLTHDDNVISNQIRRLIQHVTALGATISWTHPQEGTVTTINSSYGTGKGYTTDIPDVIIIAASTNDRDSWQYVDDTDAVFAQSYASLTRKTIASALRWHLETLQIVFPNTQIFVTTPIASTSSFNSSAMINAKVSIIKKTCAFMSVPVIDAYSECGISKVLINFWTTGDGIHPENLQQNHPDIIIGKNLLSKYTANEILRKFFIRNYTHWIQ